MCLYIYLQQRIGELSPFFWKAIENQEYICMLYFKKHSNHFLFLSGMRCETAEIFQKWSRYIRKHVCERRKFVLALINNMRPSESLNIFQCVICWECCHIYVAVWSNSSMRNCLVFSCRVGRVRTLCLKWIKIWQIIYIDI